MTLYICLQGGLGNQLFQYAAARMTKGVIIKAPFAHSGRDYRGSLFNRVESTEECPKDVRILGLESFPKWAPEDYVFPTDTVLRGYFQYLPAIQSILPQISQDITTFLAAHRDTMRSKYAIQNPSSVGFLHVRRGDYLTAPPNLHWIMPITYYTNALTKFDKPLRWFVLSDDIAWCKEQDAFTEFSNVTIIDEPDELNGLALMSLCHGGAIIANSTYSWWGAALGAENAGGPVVYPSKWFSFDKPDIFPSHWIRL